MRIGRIALGVVGMALLCARVEAAQCTASPVDAAQAKAAMEVGRLREWPLPVLRNAPIERPEDFRGVLLLAGASVYQIETVTWQIDSFGSLGIVDFDGYTADGTRTSFSRPRTKGRRIEALSDLTGFTLGDSGGGGKAQKVDSIRFAADGDGFLAITRLRGSDAKTGESVDFGTEEQVPQIPLACGLRVTMKCAPDSCQGGACGASPACPCNGSGACRNIANSTCAGVCPLGRVCNGSLEDCGCVQAPPPPNPPTDPPTNPPPGSGGSLGPP